MIIGKLLSFIKNWNQNQTKWFRYEILCYLLHTFSVKLRFSRTQFILLQTLLYSLVHSF